LHCDRAYGGEDVYLGTSWWVVVSFTGKEPLVPIEQVAG
jgi:hypothetical protein